ncbi:hypothetical protein [Pseudobacteriovorax antillogorgiicola]|uniref:Uncharacterized protein n=1 Tax=Pseudobacteriovorax antillogorgiicola TaxID=1513793 RepID=A0A1Y6CWN5_9BACT|nr:hypothetical protein [Pseudobacteriovorax antillogorgiicola]TCS44201.1 hypothetical protein EDD56_1341 [Pseudobacteriovorax antillogorgiicola]SMF80363.1 hypothetical protein SAMN06296036_1352 [Pseudobacteriovorax antillogorgiicola]
MITLFRKKLSPSSIRELSEIFDTCIQHLESSTDSDWSELGVKEIIKLVHKSKKILAKGKAPSMSSINYLFMPTGPLQETAMQNGWVDEYLALAGKVDSIVEKI